MKVWIVGVALVVSAGCSSLPFEPATSSNYRPVSSQFVAASPVEGVAPLVPSAPVPAPVPEPVPEAPPAPIVEPPALTPPPIDQPSAPIEVICPAGLEPALGAGGTITCEAPVPTFTCPAGTAPVLGDTLTCEAI